MLRDPAIRAVVPPWGGELAIDLLDQLDWDELAAARADLARRLVRPPPLLLPFTTAWAGPRCTAPT